MNKNIFLRRYQTDAVDAAMNQMSQGCRNMVLIPTGGGKTVVIAAIVERLPSCQILILTPRKRLLLQTSQTLGAHGVLSGSLGNDLGNDHKVVLGTIQTVTRRRHELKTPDVIIIDECHLVPPEGRYAALIRKFPQAKVIGLTATPFRETSSIANSSLKWKEISSVSITELIDTGHLVPPFSMATFEETVDFETDCQTLDAVTRRIVPKLVAGVRANDRKKILIFCQNIAHAEYTAQLLTQAGEKSVNIVHSKQGKKNTDTQLHAFEAAQDTAWLVNVALINVGVDIPSIDCIAILRNIGTIALLHQIIGRGLRPWETQHRTKLDCLIYDFGSGTKCFGLIDAPRLKDDLWATATSGSKPVPLKACLNCTTLMHPAVMKCSKCGFAYPMTTSLKDAAQSTQLLSTEYFAAVYESGHVEKDERGVWKVEHSFKAGGKILRAMSAMTSQAQAMLAVRVPGEALMIKQLKNNFHQIISMQK